MFLTEGSQVSLERLSSRHRALPGLERRHHGERRHPRPWSCGIPSTSPPTSLPSVRSFCGAADALWDGTCVPRKRHTSMRPGTEMDSTILVDFLAGPKILRASGDGGGCGAKSMRAGMPCFRSWLFLAALLVGCFKGAPARRAALQVSLSTPNTDDGALLFTVVGGPVDSVIPVYDQIYSAKIQRTPSR